MPFRFFRDHGVLGMNARNLQFIRPFNKKEAVQLADSKLKTKHFLSTRGIPVPRLFGTIRTRAELARFSFAALPESFVLKPDAGYGGEGIVVVVKKLGDGVWQTVSGRQITQADLVEHIGDILDGRFSIAALPDVAFFEQRVRSVEYIPGLAVQGLPDLRVIVHNLIPVMAMLRVPTPESGGKANLHLGGIGLGLDLARGETTHAACKNHTLTRLPGGLPVAGYKIPRWRAVLEIASRAQLITNLGYLAADIVLDEKDGPILLEVNARAGLSVQLANLAPLKKRLDRIRGLKVATPEAGVKLGQELFGRPRPLPPAAGAKTVVSFVEPVEILTAENTRRVRAELDSTREVGALDRALAVRLGLLAATSQAVTLPLKLRLSGKRLQLVVQLTDRAAADYKIVLGRRDLGGFLIDPALPATGKLPQKTPATATSSVFDYAAADREIAAVDSQIRLLAHLKPVNLAAEEQTFWGLGGAYDPQFRYPPLKFDAAKLQARLAKIEPPKTPLGTLLAAKKTEIDQKIALLVARGTPAFTAASHALFGFPSAAAQAAAAQIWASRPAAGFAETATIDAAAAAREFAAALQKMGLTGWQVVLRDDLATDALAGKGNTVFIRSGAVWSPERLAGTIAHEIGTHVLRTANGKRQPWKMLARGTAGYLETEEGLAIWHQNRVLPAGHAKIYKPAFNLLAVAHAATHGFRQTYQFICENGFEQTAAFLLALKLKRGLTDTSQPGGLTKDALYFTGHQKVCDFVAAGGDVRELLAAKISIADLPLLHQLEGVVPAKYLPATDA